MSDVQQRPGNIPAVFFGGYFPGRRFAAATEGVHGQEA